ncbi:hypothetical protein [Paenibacillus harenae]|uniref:hypothetical protein n=1 Tax=Paenibacillus harenae TaxID=306543 RepID=UPI00278FAB01|nr:hypothetical protein [Paenibacillus harenae]MDQ0059450.1 hypothetical protein [Paenibacillus harenae]
MGTIQGNNGFQKIATDISQTNKLTRTNNLINMPLGTIAFQIDRTEAESVLSNHLRNNWEFDDVSVNTASVELYTGREFYVSFHVNDEEDDQRERDHTDVGMINELVSCLEDIYMVPVIDFRIDDAKGVLYLFVNQSLSNDCQ